MTIENENTEPRDDMMFQNFHSAKSNFMKVFQLRIVEQSLCVNCSSQRGGLVRAAVSSLCGGDGAAAFQSTFRLLNVSRRAGSNVVFSVFRED